MCLNVNEFYSKLLGHTIYCIYRSICKKQFPQLRKILVSHVIRYVLIFCHYFFFASNVFFFILKVIAWANIIFLITIEASLSGKKIHLLAEWASPYFNKLKALSRINLSSLLDRRIFCCNGSNYYVLRRPIGSPTFWKDAIWR